MTPRRPLAVAAIAVLIVAGSMGCSSGTDTGPTAGGTAQAECQNVTAELQQIGDELATLPDKIPGDVPGALAIVTSVSGKVGGLVDRVSDPELRTRLTALSDELANLQQQLGAAVNDPLGSAGGLLDAVATTRAAYASLKGYCGVS